MVHKLRLPNFAGKVGCRPVYQETQTTIGAVGTYHCSHSITKGIQVFGSYFSK